MKAIGIIIATVFAFAAFFLAYNMLGDDGGKPGDKSNQNVAAASVEVIVAAKPIKLGEQITDSVLRTEQWPKKLMVEGFVDAAKEGKSKVVGHVARANFVPGEPINARKISNPEDPGFIAAQLPEGKRMVTISSDAVAGLAGFAYPGDRVDVMLTQSFAYPRDVSQALGVRETQVTESIVPNVKVLAVNQRATHAQATEEDENDRRRSDREKIPEQVSLEVTQSQAQKIRLAQEVGYVSLTLRSLEDGQNGAIKTAVTTRDDITDFVGVLNYLGDDWKAMNEESSGEGTGDVVVLHMNGERQEIEVPAKR